MLFTQPLGDPRSYHPGSSLLPPSATYRQPLSFWRKPLPLQGKNFSMQVYFNIKLLGSEKNVISTNSLLIAAQVLSPRVQEPLAVGGEQGHPHIFLARVGVETLCSRLASNWWQSSCLSLPNARITVKSHHTWLRFFKNSLNFNLSGTGWPGMNTCCSSGGPVFSSQHPHATTQNLLSLQLQGSNDLWPPQTLVQLHMCLR